MRLEIRNLQNQETYWIGPEGMIFGREGGPADIRVADQSVSKRHAKIYQRDGTWWLEDLKSVNGTVVNNKRITDPVPLTPGFVFALSKHRFEVLRVEGEDLGTAASLPQKSIESQRSDPSGRRSRSQPSAVDDGIGPLSPASAGPASAEPRGVGYFLIAVPKAVAYYMAAIPLMALNPIGTIRKSVREMRFAPMGRMELWAYAMPPIAFSSLMGTLGAIFAALIAGGFAALGGAIGGAVMGIVTAAVAAVVGGFVTGFFGHQILGWIVRKLKGQSDDRSRTNSIITILTAQALVAIPSALALIFSAVIARLASKISFIVILDAIPALVQMAGSLVALFAAVTWFKHFGVVSWFQKLLLVLMILVGIGGGLRVAQAGWRAVSSIGSGGSPSVPEGVDPAEIEKKAKEALEAATRTGEDAAKAAEEAAKAAEGGEKASDKDKGDDGKADPKKGEEAAAQEAAAKEAAAKEASSEKPTPAATTEPAAKDPPRRGGNAASYAEFVEKRTAIEKAIEADPTWLNRRDVDGLFRDLLRCLKEAEDAVVPERRSRDYDPALVPYYKRKAEAKQFDACRQKAASLADKMSL